MKPNNIHKKDNSSAYRIENKPFYLPINDEVEVFEKAFAEQIPLLLKGPTGCGKTRFVEYMAWRLGQKLISIKKTGNNVVQDSKNFQTGVGSLITISCHEDLTARDLTGRFIIKGSEAVWIDGPATIAVKQGAILYLDEIVEARKDVTVILHPLTDYRRILPIEMKGETFQAPKSFMVVISYNPGYQNITKNLKPSTKQRFIALDFQYPEFHKEVEIICQEGRVGKEIAEKIVRLGNDIRNITEIDLEEGVSTRLLIYTARLIKRGLVPQRACSLAISRAITDEPEAIKAVDIMIDKIFG